MSFCVCQISGELINFRLSWAFFPLFCLLRRIHSTLHSVINWQLFPCKKLSFFSHFISICTSFPRIFRRTMTMTRVGICFRYEKANLRFPYKVKIGGGNRWPFFSVFDFPFFYISSFLFLSSMMTQTEKDERKAWKSKVNGVVIRLFITAGLMIEMIVVIVFDIGMAVSWWEFNEVQSFEIRALESFIHAAFWDFHHMLTYLFFIPKVDVLERSWILHEFHPRASNVCWNEWRRWERKGKDWIVNFHCLLQ